MKIISLIILISLCSCNRSIEYVDLSKDKQIQIFSYLKNEQSITFDEPSIVFVFNGSRTACTPCMEEFPNFLISLILLDNSLKLEKYLITSEKRKNTFTDIFSLEMNFIFDTEYNLQKNGIDLSFNFIVEYDSKGELIYWNLLTVDTFEEILNRYDL